jgi:hypothetical protein
MDSLVRVELFTRVESRFHINLPEQAFAEVETPRDLLRAIARAHGSRSQYSSSVISNLTMGEGAVAPDTAQTLVDVLYWHVATHPDRPHTQFYSLKFRGSKMDKTQLARPPSLVFQLQGKSVQL